MKITLSGEELILHPAGAAFWPRHNMIIVSDMHLEKGSHFAKRGFFLPPYDSQSTLEKLLALCSEQQVRQVLILGDCFHDAKGYERLPDKAHALFHDLLRYQPIWIKGNHDKDFVPEGFAAYDVWEQNGLIFRHEAKADVKNEISGHFHPKVKIMHKGAGITRACFVEDGKKLLLPAFGSYTGGLYITSPVIKNMFDADVRYHALGEQKIYTFDTAKIDRFS